MKSVTIDGREFLVGFQRRHVDFTIPGTDRTRKVAETTCCLYGDSAIVASGTVRCCNKDQDVRKRGYKHALRKALQTVCHEHRRQVWSQMEELFV